MLMTIAYCSSTPTAPFSITEKFVNHLRSTAFWLLAYLSISGPSFSRLSVVLMHYAHSAQQRFQLLPGDGFSSG